MDNFPRLHPTADSGEKSRLLLEEDESDFLERGSVKGGGFMFNFIKFLAAGRSLEVGDGLNWRQNPSLSDYCLLTEPSNLSDKKQQNVKSSDRGDNKRAGPFTAEETSVELREI